MTDGPGHMRSEQSSSTTSLKLFMSKCLHWVTVHDVTLKAFWPWSEASPTGQCVTAWSQSRPAQCGWRCPWSQCDPSRGQSSPARSWPSPAVAPVCTQQSATGLAKYSEVSCDAQVRQILGSVLWCTGLATTQWCPVMHRSGKYLAVTCDAQVWQILSGVLWCTGLANTQRCPVMYRLGKYSEVFCDVQVRQILGGVLWCTG